MSIYFELGMDTGTEKRTGTWTRYVTSVPVRIGTYRIFRTENDEVFLKVNLGVGISPQQALAMFSTYILHKNINKVVKF